MQKLKARLRSRHNVAVSELEDHQDLWQRAAIAVVSVASSRDPLERLFEAVREESERNVPGHLLETGTEFIDAADGGAGGWSDDWE